MTDTLRRLLSEATPGPWFWAGYTDGCVELRGRPHGQRVVTAMRADPCIVDTEDHGVVLAAEPCGPCRDYARRVREDNDWERRWPCAKPENLGTVWLNTPGEGYVQPANAWAVKEVPYRNDVVRVDHPDAALIVAAVNALPALLDVAEAARKAAEAQDALDEYDVTHAEWDTVRRSPFAAAYTLAYEDLRAALARLEEAIR